MGLENAQLRKLFASGIALKVRNKPHILTLYQTPWPAMHSTVLLQYSPTAVMPYNVSNSRGPPGEQNCIIEGID